MEQHADVARRGAGIARDARERLELEAGKSVVSPLNAKSIHNIIEDKKED